MHAEQLKISSRKWMAAALTAFAEGPESYDFAVHHAGIAAEHILKAFLAGLHPALIVEARDFDSLLHATGHGTHTSIPASRAKTIGLMEAHARVHKILRNQIPINKQALEPVANARNGVAHSGVHEVAEVQTVFTTCLRLIDPLLAELKIAPEDYWGSYVSLHDKLIEERVQADRIRLEGKLAKARATFKQRYDHLAPNEREIVLATITQHSPRYMEEDLETDCPACGSQGWLMGDTHIDETNNPVVIFTPYVFACSACDLQVENEELWQLEDLGEEVEISDSPEKFYGAWEPDPEFVPEDPATDANREPDEDFYRGR
ncbi:hypothetical protein ACFY5H_33605 [Streptomyces sp. NPDC013012]|uniref:hypothetical protein n=1 Tax=Streptomyces sp. NPDC013012 TaxID=3364860 RepID=UPI00369E03A9